MSIEQKLEVVSPACFFGILPVHAPIQCDRLDTCQLDGPYALWYFPICQFKGSESSFCCRGLFYAFVVVLLERVVYIYTDAQPAYCLFVERYESILDSYRCCQLWPEVFPVASSARELCLCFAVTDERTI